MKLNYADKLQFDRRSLAANFHHKTRNSIANSGSDMPFLLGCRINGLLALIDIVKSLAGRQHIHGIQYVDLGILN